MDNRDNNEQVHPEDEDDEEDVASDEALIYGHVVNMYQYLNAAQKKMTTKKKPPKQNDRYNFRSQGAPNLIEILKEKFKQMFSNFDPPVPSTQKIQNKPEKTTPRKIHP